jgi:hypothetical protein
MTVFKWPEITDDRYFPEVAIKILAGKPIKLGKEGKGKSSKILPQRGVEWPKEVVFDITAFKALYKLTNESSRLVAAKSTTKDYFISNGTAYPWNTIFKGDFSTGGSGGGASKTEIVESLQCYYNSLLYNGSLSELKDSNVTSALLKTTEKYCDTKLSLDQLLKAAPKDWRNSFIESANALYKYTSSNGNKFSKPVYFHRGSKFMDTVYDRRKRCMDHDKDLAKERGVSVQAPSSFSNDKWNPGDIWMSTLPISSPHPFPDKNELWEGKLGVHTCDWYALQSAVYIAARRGITMGVSLKKIGNNGARVQEYNNIRTSKHDIRYEGFVFGKNGDFFSSTDIYLHFSGGQEMQLRSFNGTNSWQGEIKGGAAAGGKIGGGGVNYYTEKHFGRTIGSNTKISKSKGNTHNWVETTSPNMKDMYKLYVRFNDKQIGSHTDTIKDNEELFIKKCKEYTYQNKDASKAFIFSKYMGLLCLEAIDNNVSNIGGHFGQDIFRYAASNTDYSSFFVKIS